MMFRALKYRKIPTVMVRFPRETHELSRSGEPWHRVERLQHIVGWMDQWLQGKKNAVYTHTTGQEGQEGQARDRQDGRSLRRRDPRRRSRRRMPGAAAAPGSARRCACWLSRSGRILFPKRRSRSASRASRSARITFRSGSGSSRTCAPRSSRSSDCATSSRTATTATSRSASSSARRSFPPVPSFQLDRGRLENYPAARRTRELGATVLDGCRVRIDRARQRGAIACRCPGPDGSREITARWVVDASGRAGLLKRQLGLVRAEPARRERGAGGASARACASTTGRRPGAGRRACPSGLRWHEHQPPDGRRATGSG